ncbi:hypothetical protein FDP41_009385 [Naegleria fowleri]|uniref:Uncharacterized protein n=1 Tax=Naegleria fowleri TaxID=5763 RepID=A0A6A5BC64_NAEFO|nr:uncharacterized protein FDP41_009385 [Naegleria fowleri]KAF0972482.1 hypothetical protein FDP41_009385 [Naegleria fowleri]
MQFEETKDGKTKQTSLNFTNIRSLVREVIFRMLNASSTTTMSQRPSSEQIRSSSISVEPLSSSSSLTISNQDKALIEQLFGPSKIQNNTHRLQLKKEQLEKELEKNRHELLAKGKRNFNIVELHRKHGGSSVVFSGPRNQHPILMNGGSIEMHTLSACSVSSCSELQHDLLAACCTINIASNSLGFGKNIVFEVIVRILTFLISLLLHSR